MKSVMRSLCGGCCENRLFEKDGACHVLHLLLSIVTAGLWLPFWLLCVLSAALQPYRCSTCGKSRWLRSSSAEMARADLPCR